MLKLNVLGHVHVSRDLQVIPLSSKALALLTYLTLEGRPHHREHLAELLWDHAQALRNLRVELTRMKQQGLDLFPARQPMLSAACVTDLSLARQQLSTLTESTLAGWLALFRGTPLSGLDDLGSPELQAWVNQQRCALTEELEGLLSAAYQHFHLLGARQSYERIAQAARHLGVTLTRPSTPVPAVRPSACQIHRPQHQQLRLCLEQAVQAPQLVLLDGPNGTKHALLDELVRGTPWQVVHVQITPYRHLTLAALLHQLERLVSGQGEASPQPSVLTSATPPSTPDADMIIMAQRLGQQHRPLVLAFHGLVKVEPWLATGLRFALDLGLPLMVVVCSSSSAVLRELRLLLGYLDWARLHEITLPPLGAQGVEQLLRPAGHNPQDPHERGMVQPDFQRAARLAQHSDGWPLYLNLMLNDPAACDTLPFRQPERIHQAIMAELSGLTTSTSRGLQRLSQVLDRISPEVAQALLGEQAAEIMQEAVRAGILVPASLHEQVHLPQLYGRDADAETHLGFASEAVRIALSSTLTSTERHALRGQLLQMYQSGDPALRRLYEQLTRTPEQPVTSVPAKFTSLPLTAPLRTSSRDEGIAPPVPAPPTQDSPRREFRTANGYRVALENGYLEVLRKGRSGSAPLLSLLLPALPAGEWQLTLQLDVFQSFLKSEQPANFPLGLSTNGQPELLIYPVRQVLTPDHDPQVAVQFVETGRWVQVSGFSAGGAVTLCARAWNLAVTIGSLRWNGQELLPDLQPDRVPLFQPRLVAQSAS